MQFNQDNKVVQLCARGMELAGHGQVADAANLFTEAWNTPQPIWKKCTAAHYVARHQTSAADKLWWDETALQHALQISDESAKGVLPSLHLNIGKCYEDLNDFDNARTHYQAAFSFIDFLPGDGYGNLIRTGIVNALNRVA